MRLISLVLLMSLGASVLVRGQEVPKAGGSDVAGANPDGGVRRAQVVIDGETLFSVRGVTAYPAERRAGEIAERIREVAADPKVGANSLTLEEQPAATWILAGERRIMAVLHEDAAIEGIARGALADVYRRRIWEAVEAYRSDRRPAFLWVRALYALGATFVLFVAAWVGRRIVARLRSGVERRYRKHVEGFEDRSLHIVKVEQIWRAVAGLLNFTWGLVIAVMIYVYLNYALALFPWTRSFGRSLLAIAIDPLRTIGLGLVGVIPNLVFLAILTLLTRAVLKIARILVDGVAAGTVILQGFEAEWAWPTYRLVRLLVVMLAIVVAYPYIPGSGSDAFKGVSLFIGVIFSLGSSSLIGNFIAGYSMTYRRTFRIGDRVKIGGHTGDVEEVRLLVTRLRTPKNEEVVVPNSTILSSEIVNYSAWVRQRGLILHTTVGIGYETPWRQVEAMLLEAAARTPGLRPEPAPFVLQRELGDFCVTYEINVYCDTPQRMAMLYTELHRNILDVFNEYGVQIMTPSYEADPGEAKVVPREQWYAAPARPPEPAQAPLNANAGL